LACPQEIVGVNTLESRAVAPTKVAVLRRRRLLWDNRLAGSGKGFPSASKFSWRAFCSARIKLLNKGECAI
jgi:hypothetical protein